MKADERVDESPRTLADLLAFHARAHPEWEAIRTEEGEALAYGSWLARARSVADALRDRVAPGDVVALRFADSRWLSYAAAYIGTTMAGAVPFPTSALLQVAEARAQLEVAGARLVVRPAGSPTVAGVAIEDTGVQSPRRLGAEIAELVGTSGTTGRPAIVAVPHENLVARLLTSAYRGDPGERETFLHALHISTAGGQTPLVASLHLRLPTRAIVMAEFEPARALRLIERERVSVLSLVPAMGTSLLSVRDRAPDVSSVHTVVVGGAPVAPALVQGLTEMFPRASVSISYTTTEALPAAVQMRFDPRKPGAVGKALGAAEVSVRGDDGRPAPPGVDGRVLLRSAGVAPRWYLEERGQTVRTSDGWVRTGDVGHLDEDGFLYITDREKDVIITGGRKVSSIEIEAALLEIPAVADVAVFGLDDPQVGERVAAALVLSAPELETVRAAARTTLSGYKVPHQWFVVDRIPRNAAGKPLKKELRQRFAHHVAGPGAGPAGAASATEAAIARAFEKVLERPEIGPDDDFYGAGGTSITAAAMVALLAEELGVEIDVATTFEFRTVREIARLLESRSEGPGREQAAP